MDFRGSLIFSRALNIIDNTIEGNCGPAYVYHLRELTLKKGRTGRRPALGFMHVHGYLPEWIYTKWPIVTFAAYKMYCSRVD